MPIFDWLREKGPYSFYKFSILVTWVSSSSEAIIFILKQ